MAATRARTFNLFLFRHIITGKVLVSPRFDLKDNLLNQIGEHRNSVKIRHDHWVPFSVVTGLPSPEIQDALTRHLLPRVYARPVAGQTFPLPPKHPQPHHPNVTRTNFKLLRGVPDRADFWKGWEVPEDVQLKTLALCRGLLHVAGEDGRAKKEDMVALNCTVWWERDEYRRLIEGRRVRIQDKNDPFLFKTETLYWPPGVEHRMLELKRGRSPVGISLGINMQIRNAFGRGRRAGNTEKLSPIYGK
ncbi:hypothetical protein DFJ73DRAFT_270383 [Zopfochytrium polystomum]|nr:hypothetical protein DFJ73DRAFT_270383 [Zopfochytrium polystomum]